MSPNLLFPTTWTAGVVTFIWLASASLCAAQAAPYQILVTNDDGIESPGIQVLAEELARVGQVTVVAPCGQRSGSSMSIALGQQLTLRAVPLMDGTTGHCVDATPAGSVHLAVSALAPEGGFDLVVSGINRGANVGDLAHMSGTVGAAMMGAFHGVPAIAASLEGRAGDFRYSARFVAQFVRTLREHAPTPGVVYSINLPKATQAETAGVAVATMGGAYLRILYDEVEGAGGDRVFTPRFEPPLPYPAGSDSEAYARGMITITPIAFDWTARDRLAPLETWRLTHRLDEGPPNRPDGSNQP